MRSVNIRPSSYRATLQTTTRTVLAGVILILPAACAELFPGEPSAPQSGSVDSDGRARGLPPPLGRTKSEHQCTEGVSLERELEADRQEKWSRIQGVLQNGASLPTVSASFACELAYNFGQSCPKWETNVRDVAIDVCGVALSEDLGREKILLSASLGKSDIGLPAEMPIWPRTNAAGGMMGTMKHHGFNLSLARLTALGPAEDSDESELLHKARGLAKDTLQYERDIDQLGVSCDDVAALRKKAPTVGKFTAGRYLRLSDQRKDSQVSARAAQIHKIIGKQYVLADVENLDSVRADIASTQTLVDGIRCYDSDAAATQAALVQTWASLLNTELNAEAKCRVTPECLGARVALELCPLVEDRLDTLGRIKELKRMGARVGVVSLSDLHDLGERLQSDEDSIGGLKERYAAVAKKFFTESLCSAAVAREHEQLEIERAERQQRALERADQDKAQRAAIQQAQRAAAQRECHKKCESSCAGNSECTNGCVAGACK